MQANSSRSITACACALAVAGVSTLITIAPSRAEPATTDRGGVEPRTIDSSEIDNFRIDPSQPSPSGVRLRGAPSAHEIFDGYETYDLGLFDGQLKNAPGGVLSIIAESEMLIVNTTDEGLPPGLDSLGVGDFQHLKDARGDMGFVSEEATRWLYTLDRLFVPTPEEDVIVCMDMYFPDLETLYTFEPVSIGEGFIVTRIMQAGWWESSPLTSDTGGVLTRPAVLGPRIPDASPTHGTFYVLPLDTETDGELAPFETRTGEWFTIAVRLSSQGFSVWVRDGQTDGSNGVLIEDPFAPTLLESGWCRVYPGRPAEQMAPSVWTGYGVPFNDTGGTPPLMDHFNAGSTVDGVRSMWFAQTGTPGDPEWSPTNRHMNNLCIVGPSTALCPWDLTGSGSVGSADLGFLLGCWGAVTDPTCAIADFTASGSIGAGDLAAMLGNWGPCPD